MTTDELGMGSITDPIVCMDDPFGRLMVMTDPEGERYGGRSTDRRRKSVVPVSANVLMTVCFGVGEEEFVLTLLCLILLHMGKGKSLHATSSPPCHPLVLPPATSVGVLALRIALVYLVRSASIVRH